MSTAPDPSPSARQTASSARELASRLVDGHGEPACAEAACSQWRRGEPLQQAWRDYHLIGDAMRSRELAGQPARDEAFLNRLCERLAQEPAIVAPSSSVERVTASTSLPQAALRVESRTARWLMPAAVAAGFVAVAGALLVTRSVDAPAMGSGPVLAVGGVSAGERASAAGAAVLPVDATMIRDARIDEYLLAHRQMRTAPMAALPGGGVRSVDVMLPPAPAPALSPSPSAAPATQQPATR
jgi:sigma-E factor negative regulatory protein RseA